MKLIILIITLLLVNEYCIGQYSTSYDWKYYEQLSKEAHKKYPNSSYELIKLDSLNNIIFEIEKAKIGMDTLFNWQILFEYSYESVEINGMDSLSNYFSSDSLLAINQKEKHLYNASKIYNGKNIFEGLEIDSTFLDKESNITRPTWFSNYDTLSVFSNIRERNDPFNRVWTPYISENYLVLRYVHSYPNGNEKSFYTENILYFKRKEWKRFANNG